MLRTEVPKLMEWATTLISLVGPLNHSCTCLAPYHKTPSVHLPVPSSAAQTRPVIGKCHYWLSGGGSQKNLNRHFSGLTNVWLPQATLMDGVAKSGICESEHVTLAARGREGGNSPVLQYNAMDGCQGSKAGLHDVCHPGKVSPSSGQAFLSLPLHLLPPDPGPRP